MIKNYFLIHRLVVLTNREIGIPISANNASWANTHDSSKFGKQFK
jgi:hypothetical protein